MSILNILEQFSGNKFITTVAAGVLGLSALTGCASQTSLRYSEGADYNGQRTAAQGVKMDCTYRTVRKGETYQGGTYLQPGTVVETCRGDTRRPGNETADSINDFNKTVRAGNTTVQTIERGARSVDRLINGNGFDRFFR
jgi:hypothetical protein